MSNRPQGSLPSNTKDRRREEKEYCKVINLRSGKGVDIPVGMPKRKMEPDPTKEETQIEEEPQQPICQYTSESSQAIATAERNDSVHVEEEAAATAATNQSRS